MPSEEVGSGKRQNNHIIVMEDSIKTAWKDSDTDSCAVSAFANVMFDVRRQNVGVATDARTWVTETRLPRTLIVEQTQPSLPRSP